MDGVSARYAGLARVASGFSVISTLSGALALEVPSLSEIQITDIATALSRIPRFNGHTRAFYSVAQHCVSVSCMVPHELALTGLLHDAAEAYIGDITRPVRRALARAAGFDVVEEIEMRIERAISHRFGIVYPWPAEIRHADNVMLATEKRDLVPDPVDWPGLPDPRPDTILPLDADEAERLFLSRFEDLLETR